MPRNVGTVKLKTADEMIAVEESPLNSKRTHLQSLLNRSSMSFPAPGVSILTNLSSSSGRVS